MYKISLNIIKLKSNDVCRCLCKKKLYEENNNIKKIINYKKKKKKLNIILKNYSRTLLQ